MTTQQQEQYTPGRRPLARGAMKAHMIRFREERWQAAARRAEREGVVFAEVIRDLVDGYIDAPAEQGYDGYDEDECAGEFGLGAHVGPPK